MRAKHPYAGFMPVGTAATVRPCIRTGAGARRRRGARHTYHLMLRPGAERVAALGGLHKFMNWPIHPDDSGGFQYVAVKIAQAGREWRHLPVAYRRRQTCADAGTLDGDPAPAGADIQMQFDECVKLPCSPEEAERAMRLSLRWAERSRKAFGEQPGRACFRHRAGRRFAELRVESARALAGMGFDGMAIGGLAWANRRTSCWR